MGLRVEQLFNVDGTILITGETGTGKSFLARQIHKESARSHLDFAEVNLATLSDTLLESELFGHVKGSFTGAVSDRKGYCESVGSGTLFLDEISELSIQGQMKLLRILEERRFTPVGSCKSLPFRGRIIVATNRDLKKLVGEGKFREDLFYRLQIFTFELKPLRERRLELNALIDSFFSHFKKIMYKPNLNIEPGCRLYLENYLWPGNIRQLKNCMEYLVACSQNHVRVNNLPDWIKETEVIVSMGELQEHIVIDMLPENYYMALEIFEKFFLKSVLRKNRGKINNSALLMGISKATLIAKARKYAINTMQLRADAMVFKNIA